MNPMSWVYPSPTIEISRFRQKDPNSMGYHNQIILALLNRKGPRWRSNQLTFSYLTGASDQIPPKRIISVLQFWDSKKGLYTPLKINGWNLKIHQIENENHLNQTSICVNLSGSTKLFTTASCHPSWSEVVTLRLGLRSANIQTTDMSESGHWQPPSQWGVK